MASLHVPGLSIAVIHHGTLDWTGSYGLASNAEPVTPDTRFETGELSMPITAMLILSLAERRKIALDADINRYLASWRIASNNLTDQRPVTARELLNHTAGTTVRSFTPLPAGEPIPSIKSVLDGLPPATNLPVKLFRVPGSAWRFSSGGYAVLQEAVQDTTGLPFEAAAQRIVMTPLRMTHSTFGGPPASLRATGYDEDGKLISRNDFIYPVPAAAGLWSTPADMANFVIEVQKALAGRSRLISKALAEQMITPAESSGSGLGVLVKGAAGHRLFQFSGSSNGFVCAFVAYEDGDGVVVMTNGNRGAELIDDVVRTVAEKYGWPDFRPTVRPQFKVAAATLESYVGFYRLSKYRYLEVRRVADHLQLDFPDGSSRALFPMAEQVWFFPDNGDVVNFDLDTDGKSKAITDHHGALATAALRITDSAARTLNAALTFKVAMQTRDPDAETMLRRYFAELKTGSPDYDGEMAPAVAAAQQGMLEDYRRLVTRLGSLRGVKFHGVTQSGADIYRFEFDHGQIGVTVLVGDDRKIEALSLKEAERNEPTLVGSNIEKEHLDDISGGNTGGQLQSKRLDPPVGPLRN